MSTRATNRAAAVNKSNSVRQRVNAINDQVFDNQQLRYRIIMTQAGTDAPTLRELVNELSGEVVWAYTGAGIYTGTLAGAFLEDAVIPVGKFLDVDTLAAYTLRRGTDNTIILETATDGTLANDLLTDEIIELIVSNPLEG